MRSLLVFLADVLRAVTYRHTTPHPNAHAGLERMRRYTPQTIDRWEQP